MKRRIKNEYSIGTHCLKIKFGIKSGKRVLFLALN